MYKLPIVSSRRSTLNSFHPTDAGAVADVGAIGINLIQAVLSSIEPRRFRSLAHITIQPKGSIEDLVESGFKY